MLAVYLERELKDQSDDPLPGDLEKLYRLDHDCFNMAQVMEGKDTGEERTILSLFRRAA
jgi:hypothetical protein